MSKQTSLLFFAFHRSAYRVLPHFCFIDLLPSMVICLKSFRLKGGQVSLLGVTNICLPFQIFRITFRQNIKDIMGKENENPSREKVSEDI
jgi:hypothetical protein